MTAPACSMLATCRCELCLPDMHSTPALERCPQCTNLKSVDDETCGECAHHNVRHAARVERAMKVAAFGKGRC